MKTLCTMFALLALAAYGPAEDRSTGGPLCERFEELNLTEDQEVKIAELRKEFRPKVEAAAKELAAAIKEEVDKVRATLTPEQTAKLDELRADRREHRAAGLAERVARLEDLELTDAELGKIREIRKAYRPRIAKALDGLKDVLTGDQRLARDEALKAGKKHREVVAALNLTDDQKTKLEAICKEVGTIVREEMAKIRDVLTTAQEEKLQEIKEERAERVRDRMAYRIATLSELNLTDEQKARITAIRADYRPRVYEAGNKLRAAVRAELAQVMAVIKA